MVLGITLGTNALATAFGPLFAETDARDPSGAAGLYGRTLLGATAGATLLAGIGVAAALLLLPPTGAAGGTATLAAAFLPWLAPAFVLRVAFQVVRSVLEMRRRFAAPAWAQVVRALAALGILAAVPTIHGLVAALVLPEAAQLAWVAAASRAAGLVPRFGPGAGPAPGAVWARFAPLLAGEAGVSLNFFVDKLFAAGLAVGSVTALEYADRLRVIPETLFVQAVVVVLLTDWATWSAAGRPDAVREGCRRAVVWTVALGTPAVAALALLSRPIVDLVYGRGQMDEEGLALTAAALAAFAPGLLPQSLGVIFARVLAARGRARALMVQGLASAGSNAALDALLVPHLGVPGLALATTVNMVIVPAALWLAVRADLGEPVGAKAGRLLLGIALAHAAVALAVAPLLGAVPGGPLGRIAVGACALSIPAAGGLLAARRWRGP